MTNNLPPELAAFVEAKVAAGEFATADDVIVEGVRRFRDSDRRLTELRKSLQEAADSLGRGEGIVCETDEDIDRFFDGIMERVRDRLAHERASAS